MRTGSVAALAASLCALAGCALACSSGGSSPGGDGGTGPDARDAAKDRANSDAADATMPGDGGTPLLTDLSVTGAGQADASAPLGLVPPFSSTIHDYYVRCAAGTNDVTVTMVASPGAESLLAKPVTSPSRPKQTLTVKVAVNQAIVATATRGAMKTEYWVRCLPPDFPQLLWTDHPSAGARTPGYYLVGNLYVVGSGGPYAMILDSNGVPVWYEREQGGVSDVDNVVSGAVSFFTTLSTAAASSFEVESLSPRSTTPEEPDGAITDQHELRLLTNGDYLVISNPVVGGVDLTGMSLRLSDGGTETLTGPESIATCNLVEFKPDGTVVWTWNGADHLDAVKDSVSPVLAIKQPKTGLLVDPFHCNSIDVDPANQNLLVSARQMNAVFYIEKLTGRVLWKMGGANFSKDGATYLSVSSPFYGQHDARLEPGWSPTCHGGSGRITLFDDQTYGPGRARAVAYDVVVGDGDAGDGGAAGCDGGSLEGGTGGSVAVEWEYRGALRSNALGSFRISADGSRVVGWGISGHTPNIVFSEVDIKGNDVLDFYFNDGNVSARAIKVPITAFDLNVLRNAAGL